MSEAAFDKVINVNLKGTFLVNQVASVGMMKAKVEYGSIVNISSISGNIRNIIQSMFTFLSMKNLFFRANWKCWTNELFSL